jgi:hypothetical protein
MVLDRGDVYHDGGIHCSFCGMPMAPDDAISIFRFIDDVRIGV